MNTITLGRQILNDKAVARWADHYRYYDGEQGGYDAVEMMTSRCGNPLCRKVLDNSEIDFCEKCTMEILAA